MEMNVINRKYYRYVKKHSNPRGPKTTPLVLDEPTLKIKYWLKFLPFSALTTHLLHGNYERKCQKITHFIPHIFSPIMDANHFLNSFMGFYIMSTMSS